MILLRRLHTTSFKSLRDVCVAFPSSGAILVEGPNESGKSTLFESIFFGLYGAPIVTEDNPRALDSLIAHGEEAARVCLELEAGGTSLRIERTVRRTRSTLASLVVGRPGEPPERITGVRAVNARVIAEMGGLDGSALLNSCFVEQKRLSKLEELDARERRDSLLRILNLDQLSRLEDLYRVRPVDEQRVRDAQARADLARLGPEITDAERRVAMLRARVDEERNAAHRVELERAEAALQAADERGALLRRLRDLETARARADAAAREDEHTASGPAPGGPAALIAPAGVAGATGLLVAGVIALAGGRGELGALCILLAAVCAVAASVAYRRLSDRRRAATRDVARMRSRDGASRAELLMLRARAGLRDDVDIDDALAAAVRAAGAAQHAVEYARRAGPPGGARVAARLDSDDPALHELETAERQIHDLRSRGRYLAETLGVEPGSLDARLCREELERAERDLETKRHASVIVVEARKRIVERVLPETERNMKLILPLLTAGRYHDARVTEDYRVDMWDDEAGRYVGKNLYSGGTKDQISLALRLAFAIASLPQELGSSPGFLFMDEPLSSFDEERTLALVELITRGELARAFPQICIISHSRGFDPALFPYIIRMRDGGISHSNLGGASH